MRVQVFVVATNPIANRGQSNRIAFVSTWMPRVCSRRGAADVAASAAAAAVLSSGDTADAQPRLADERQRFITVTSERC